MKQNSLNKNRKWLWLILGVALLVVAAVKNQTQTSLSTKRVLLKSRHRAGIECSANASVIISFVVRHGRQQLPGPEGLLSQPLKQSLALGSLGPY